MKKMMCMGSTHACMHAHAWQDEKRRGEKRADGSLDREMRNFGRGLRLGRRESRAAMKGRGKFRRVLLYCTVHCTVS